MECTLIQKLELATLLICKSFPVFLNWCSVRRRSWTRPEQMQLMEILADNLFDWCNKKLYCIKENLWKSSNHIQVLHYDWMILWFQYYLIKATNHDWRTHQLYSLTLKLLSANRSCRLKWSRFWLLVSFKSSRQSPLLTTFYFYAKVGVDPSLKIATPELISKQLTVVDDRYCVHFRNILRVLHVSKWLFLPVCNPFHPPLTARLAAPKSATLPNISSTGRRRGWAQFLKKRGWAHIWLAQHTNPSQLIPHPCLTWPVQIFISLWIQWM